jgi:hypothetical protein
MVFNATFNNIQLYLGGQFYWWRKWSARRKSPTCRKLLKILITLCCIEFTSAEMDSNSLMR